LAGVTHSFASFSAAAAEAENSVVWSGTHFRFDVVAGDAQGKSVANYVDQNFFQPVANSVYQQTNIVSNIAGLARHTDPRLQNPWGISLSPDGLFRVDDNHTGLSTVYDVNGHREGDTVEIPLPPSSTGLSPAAPTGTVLNTTTGFVISEGNRSAPATSIFATEDGTIAAWNEKVDPRHALLEVDNSGAGVVYKALTLGTNSKGTFIFATNFHNGTVDVFNSQFQQVHLAGGFIDPNIPAGFAPFGIKNINGTIFVTYAKQLAPDNHDDQAGPGNGYIDEFDTNGNLIERFASQGPLNSPHGMALAPADFGAFSNALLVGNFGDGRINAYDLKTGKFLGQLADAVGHPITNVGIWGMTFGNGAGGTKTDTLYFAAGINGEADGLVASIRLANPGPRGDGRHTERHAGQENQVNGGRNQPASPTATLGSAQRILDAVFAGLRGSTASRINLKGSGSLQGERVSGRPASSLRVLGSERRTASSSASEWSGSEAANSIDQLGFADALRTSHPGATADS
jgi:uncharacterized protein (TIGR03118 family)